MHLQNYVQNILYTIQPRLLYAKDYIKKHSRIHQAQIHIPRFVRGLPPFFRFRESVTLLMSSLVLNELHALDQKPTFAFPLIISCESM